MAYRGHQYQRLPMGAGGPRPGDAPWLRRQLAASQRFPSPVENPDVHELLKATTLEPRGDRDDLHAEKSRPSPWRVYGVSDHYVVLDSYAKVMSSEMHRGRLEFNFAIQNETEKQRVGIKDVVRNVIEIEIGEFCIPAPLLQYFPATLPATEGGLSLSLNGAPNPNTVVSGTDPVRGTLSQLAFCDRVTLFFPELGLQSFADFKQRRHHFEFRAQLEEDRGAELDDGEVTERGLRVKLTPIEPKFIFTAPIQDVHGLTARFFNPDEELRLPPDEIVNVTLTTEAATGLLTINAPAGASPVIDFTTILSPGDRIFFENVQAEFSVAPNNLNDNLNAYLNRNQGHLVGTNGLAATSFRLNPDVDLTATYGAGFSIAQRNGGIIMRIAKNRMRIPLRMRGVEDRLTNYINPI